MMNLICERFGCKEWLKEHGFNSWEALHTSLMKDETRLTQRVPDLGQAVANSSNDDVAPSG